MICCYGPRSLAVRQRASRVARPRCFISHGMDTRAHMQASEVPTCQMSLIRYGHEMPTCTPYVTFTRDDLRTFTEWHPEAGRWASMASEVRSKQRGGLPRHTDGRETGRETEGRPTGQLSKTRGKLGSLEARSLSGPSWSDTWTPGDSGQADRTSRQQTAARRNNPPSGNPDAAPGGALLSRIQSPTAQPLRVPVCHMKGDLPDSEHGLTSDATWPVFPLPGQIGL